MLTGLFMLWTLFAIWKRGFRSHARISLQLEGKIPVDSQGRALPRHHRRRDVRALRRRGDAVGGRRRRRSAVRDPRGRHLPHVAAAQWWAILRDTTRESLMILMIIGAAVLFGYMLTSLYLTQTLAQAITRCTSIAGC